MNRILVFLSLSLGLLMVAGCTVHPQGEQAERDLAQREGQPFLQPPEDRHLPALPSEPTPDDLVRYAWLASPELEQRYWEWKSAIEQIPQDGTQPTNLVLFGNVPITNGSTASNKTVVTLANDPMADIQWPSKPTTAAQRALEQARAAGWRFQQAKLDLRQKVLTAYDEYALGAELLRLEQANAQLLMTTAEIAEANIASGRTTQAASLSARNEEELSRNQAAELRSKLPRLHATLNAALGREPDAPLAPADSLPPLRDPAGTLARLQLLLTQHSAQLAAQDAEVRGKQQSVALAKLQYVPDFSLSGSTDLGGIAQSLSAMVTVPLLKYQAINAAIAQAEANLRASQAMRRQTEYDLRSKLVGTIAELHDLDRQVRLLDEQIIPRAECIASIGQSEYEAGHISLMDALEARRSVIGLKRLVATMRTTRDERLLDIEGVVAVPEHPKHP